MLPFIGKIAKIAQLSIVSRHEAKIPGSTEQRERTSPNLSRTIPKKVPVAKSSAKLPKLTLERGASPALEEELMKHPFWRYKGVKPVLKVKTLLETPSIYGVIESNHKNEKKLLLRSPERGLENITKKRTPPKGSRIIAKDFRIDHHSLSSPLANIQSLLPVLFPSLCIGCAVWWSTFDLSQLATNPFPNIDPDCLLRSKEILEGINSPSSDSQAHKLVAEAVSEVAERGQEQGSLELKKQISANVIAVLISTIILAVLLTSAAARS